MKAGLRFGTLRLTYPVGGTILTGLLVLIVVYGCGETLARNKAVQSQLDLPVLSGNNELGPKVFLADNLAAADGHIDCFFIGNSAIAYDIQPEAFGQAYQAETGSPLKCFNFGIFSLSINGTEPLIQILVNRYHPRLIIFGVHYESFGTNTFDMQVPWARSQSGAADIRGWLENSSMSYRYILTYKTVRPKKMQYSAETMSPLGSLEPVAIFDQDQPMSQAFRELLKKQIVGYDLTAPRNSLDSILSHNGRDTQIVVVDMPVPLAAIQVLESDGFDPAQYQSFITTQASRHGSVLIPSIPPELAVKDGYRDPIHMNYQGATVYSTWLGHQFGQAVRQGLIRALTP